MSGTIKKEGNTNRLTLSEGTGAIKAFVGASAAFGEADAAFAPAHVLLAALRARRGPGKVMDEMGRTDPGQALRVYRQAMHRDEDEKRKLPPLVDGMCTTDHESEMIEAPT
jgi:hypothetical protein